MNPNASHKLFNRHLVGWLCGISAYLLACSSASAGFVFTSGQDTSASGSSGYAAVRDRNFSNAGGPNGTTYIGTQKNLGTGSNQGNVPSTAWSQQTYSFTYTYDPTDGIVATTLTPNTSGNPYTTWQGSVSVPAAPANELQILDTNSKGGDLILTLNSINSVGYGGSFTGSNGSVAVTGGTQQFDGATWNGASTYLNAYLDDSKLFNQGFELFGTITVGASVNSTNYGNNEGSKIEIDLANVTSSTTTSSAPVPEPSTITLAALGVAAAVALRWRKRNPNVLKTAA